MNKTKIIILAAASMMTAKFAFASMPLPMGWYAEGNIGQSSAQEKNYSGSTSVDRTGFGWNIDLGYKFMPYFGGEIGYTKYANSEIQANNVQYAKDIHSSYDIAAKGILPVSTSGVELFAKLGIARLRSDTSITNTAVANGTGIITGTRTATGLYMGLGGDYAVMPNVIVNAQWARAKGNSDTGDLDLYSLGLAYLMG